MSQHIVPLYREWLDHLDAIPEDGVLNPEFPFHLRQYLVVGDEGYVQIVGHKEISYMHDMSDTGTMDEIKGVYTWMGDHFAEVLTGKGFTRSSDPESFVYGYTPLLADGIIVGEIAHTDH